ncbi:hypothetical protein QYE76_026773 [Lolium multiflorum]|uniref:DUF4371 domain-containing protein n=1 Tax=Lolium multiflorum TaxID=4521 RepID=A0AAD8RID0_LOLMU|nr:hypothetical protein QYE76_026773 [Lolium multiflorum]
MGKGSNSAHNYSVQCYDNLKNGFCQIARVMQKVSKEEILKNRLRLKTSIDVVKWLALQACSFRGNKEGPTSNNQGNFLEMVKVLSSYNAEVAALVGNAPGNAKYNSPEIQKEILNIIATDVQASIREEIGEAKFCLLVDEARDESKREQMALVLRFVDTRGFIRERLSDTTAATLKEELCAVLDYHKLDVQNIRGQGYDGASNMRGEWNGLQQKFKQECPYAYYVHCFAHQLQLSLVAASKEVTEVHNFFEHLAVVVNTVASSCKRNDELRAHQVAEILNLVELDELETGSGANQIGALQRPSDTRWSSHFSSVCSLLRLYKPTFLVLKAIASSKGASPSARGKAAGSVKLMMSFDFVFILHVMKELMGITDLLCKKLQQKSQDIVNAMHDVATTKELIQKLRDDGLLVTPSRKMKSSMLFLKCPAARLRDRMVSQGLSSKDVWDIIKGDVMEVVNSFGNLHAQNFHWLNSANIALLPKKDGAEEITGYRPISLIHAIAKIIAKILALRLAPFMDDLVSNAQSAFYQKTKHS